MQAPERWPLVIIVVLNWNNALDTLECLESIQHLVYPNTRVLVVDNGSSDGSADQIAAAYPALDLLRLEKNLGYAEGNNAGMQRAMEYSPDYVFVLNNDTLLDRQMLNQLVLTAERNPRAAMVGPTMFCTSPEHTLFAAGSFVDWQHGTILHRGMFRPDSEIAGLSGENPVDFIVGCGVLVRSSFIRAHGGLDPIYYLNYEDVEWGVRALRRGYLVLHEPAAVMWHKVSATLGLASPANTYYMTRNALFFFWQHTTGLTRLGVTAHIFARTVRTIGAWSLHRRYQTPVYRQKRDANLFALRDFIFNHTGPMPAEVSRTCYSKVRPIASDLGTSTGA